jgi:hypothetical protein
MVKCGTAEGGETFDGDLYYVLAFTIAQETEAKT